MDSVILGAMPFATLEQLESGVAHILEAPRDGGVVRLIVRRPGMDRREVLTTGQLDTELGLVGDDWADRGSGSTPDGAPAPYAQVTIMNARYAALIADGPEGWAQAGDQLYVDLDISTRNLPPGSELVLGSAVLRISAEPHTGCAKFSTRFGSDALRFSNSEQGRSLRLRGANAMVIRSGSVRTGGAVRRR